MLCANTWLHVCLMCVCCICWQHACTAEVQACLSSRLHSQTGLSFCSKCTVMWGRQKRKPTCTMSLYNTQCSSISARYWMHSFIPSICPSVCPSVHPSLHPSIDPSVRPSIHASIPRSIRSFTCSCMHAFIHQVLKSLGASYDQKTQTKSSIALQLPHDR